MNCGDEEVLRSELNIPISSTSELQLLVLWFASQFSILAHPSVTFAKLNHIQSY